MQLQPDKPYVYQNYKFVQLPDYQNQEARPSQQPHIDHIKLIIDKIKLETENIN